MEFGGAEIGGGGEGIGGDGEGDEKLLVFLEGAGGRGGESTGSEERGVSGAGMRWRG